MVGGNEVHEKSELEAPAALLLAGFDQTVTTSRAEQGSRAMAFVMMVKTGDRFPWGSFNALRSLDVGFSSMRSTTRFSSGCK